MDGFATSQARERLEAELLEKLHEAEQAYRKAKAEYQAVLEQNENLRREKRDGMVARQQAAIIEQQALAAYSRTLKTFTDLVVHNVVPDPAPGQDR